MFKTNLRVVHSKVMQNESFSIAFATSSWAKLSHTREGGESNLNISLV